MIRTFLAAFIGNATKTVIRLMGKGKGEAAPGLIALKIDPQFIYHRQLNIPTRIIITGTNGKTTSTHLFGKILRANNKHIVTNPHGSNLSRGVAAALLVNDKIDVSLWETDEAAFIDIFEQTKPTHVVLLNLFRDQLDRYGEIDTTVKKWLKILKISPPLTLVINADDPNLENIARQCKQHQIVRFGISQIERINAKLAPETHGDAIFCPECHRLLKYTLVSFSHLGNYSCTCGFKRSELDTFIEYNSEKIKVCDAIYSSKLKGIYSAYNIGVCVALASQFDFPKAIVKDAITEFIPSFGRQEVIKIKNKEIHLLLIKNPTGTNQNLQIIEQEDNQIDIVIAINDNFADGRDISWLWDVDFESLKHIKGKLIVSGIRALDMALRLKYAGIDSNRVMVEMDLEKSVKLVLNLKFRQGYILPTYTAMLETRKILKKIKS